MARALVVAHRGSSHTYAEHTLQAFEAAVAEGADALECDIRLTRDGVLVCVHDRRVDRTSDGRGRVSTLELADLRELDFASWKRATGAGGPPQGSDGRGSDGRGSDGRGSDGRGPHDLGLDLGGDDEPDLDAHRVLTLERLLQLVVDAGRPVQLHVETKHPTRYGGRVERALLDLLDRYGLTHPPTRAASRVYVVSYSLTSLRRVHARAPRLPTILNTDFVLPWLRAGRLPPRVAGVGVGLRAVRASPGFVRRVHARGRRVHVFTVDAPEDVDFVAGLGVDAIISNHPAGVLHRLTAR